ncbi:MAG: TrkA family potassium uptake protein [Acidimicrobiia bacterium]|nr:TrkA family potassium uptake protein [Acidimicrobiia bacterium]
MARRRRRRGSQATAGGREPTGAPTPAEAGSQILVLGLGRFGGALAQELVDLGFEVLGVDVDERLVQGHAELLTHVVQADTTDPAALRQLGAGDFQSAVVGIGTNIEASILTTAALVDLGVPNIWAKAVTESHGRILERVGANRVVFPEHDMGQRVAHLVSGRMLDWFQLDENFALVETVVPKEFVGMTLGDSGLRARFDLTVVCVKPAGQGFTYATAETVLAEGDVLVVAGRQDKAERFAHMT